VSRTRPRGRRYRTAVRFLVAEYLRNRTALLLLVVFVPIWYAVFVGVIPHDLTPFRYRATSTFVSVDGQQLSLLTAGLNAISLINGFLVFSTTKRGLAFDHRLTLCGYPQRTLLAAKFSALLIATLAITAYATCVLLAFFRPVAIAVVFLGLAATAIAYGALGFLLGVLVRGELEGFFVVIMVSLLDTFLQNPVGNPVANKDFLTYFPSFGGTQLYVAGGFTHLIPWQYLGVALAWPLGFGVVGFLIFSWRTRVPRKDDESERRSRDLIADVSTAG
jgi:ABC-2 type transport system permease protein